VIKGFITAAELVFGLSAHFLKGAEKSGPIFWEGQLEEACQEEKKTHVSEIMIPIKGCIQDTEMLMEAVFLFNKYQVSFLPVVNQVDVVGIIHIEDILEEITRILLK
jgi:predicted transcriptional regulator